MNYYDFVLLVILATCNYVEMVIVTTNEGMINGAAVNYTVNIGVGGLLGIGVTLEVRQYYAFKGIPYAEPPVGPRRFLAPLRKQPWNGVRQAIEDGPICTQYHDILHIYPPNQSEDCLFCNVYTKNLTPGVLMPVLFGVHGGRFEFGDITEAQFGAKYIVDKNVVLVMCSYRLDSLGFCNLGIPEVPGNAGMRDQNLALKWVRDNIQHFGGDPNQVTLMGESAGSASVVYHMMSPMSVGLFNRTITMSGAPWMEWALYDRPKDRCFELGRMLGKNTEDPYEMLTFLQSQPALRLVNKFPIVRPEDRDWNFGFKMTAFQPCLEEDFGQERFLVESPIETIKRGNLIRGDLMVGYTSMEGLSRLPEILTTNMYEKYNNKRDLLIPRDILLGPGPVDRVALAERIKQYYFGDGPIDSSKIARLVKYISEEVFVYNVNKFLKYLNTDTTDFKTFLYKFSIVTSRNRYSGLGELFGIHGVAHTDDLLYLFETGIPTTDDIVDITNRVERYINWVVTMFTNFVKFGNPTPDNSLGVTWPRYNSNSKAYLNINKTLITGNDPDADVNAFWTGIYQDGNAELS